MMTSKSREIQELIKRLYSDNSIEETEKLELKICEWCYSLFNSIREYEKSIEGFDDSLSPIQGYFNPGGPDYFQGYYFYETEDDLGYVGLGIEYNMVTDSNYFPYYFFIPYCVIDDLEDCLEKYYVKKKNKIQERLRMDIMYHLRQAKGKIRELEDAPDDFKGIIDNKFWDKI